MNNQSFVAEAKRRIAENQKLPNLRGFLDEEIVQLMADFAAEAWKEGYDDGYSDGIEWADNHSAG